MSAPASVAGAPGPERVAAPGAAERVAGGGERRRRLAGIAFAAPALAVLALFFFVPVVAALVLSVSDFDIYALADRRALRFAGLDNYRALLADPMFWQALGNTAYFVFVGAPLSIAVSLGAALLVDAKAARLRGLFRTIFFLPVTTTIVAVAVVWRYLYQPRFGLLNQALAAAGIAPIDWLGDPAWSMPAIIVMAVWKNFGFHMIVLLAGLQAIPQRLYEAAALDGAGPWRRFVSITLPLLAPTLAFVTLLTAIGYFQLFAEPYVMTGGGPAGSTRSVVLLMYEEGFRWWNLGRAAAVAFLLFAVLLVLTAVQRRVQARLDAGAAT